MGFIEETGAAQHLRDARITTIYEGTTGIQANDLIGRKTARDAGAVGQGHCRRRSTRSRRGLPRARSPTLQAIGVQLAAADGRTAGGDRMARARVRPAAARRARGRGELPQAVGYRRRRLADGPRGAGGRGPARGRRGRLAVPARARSRPRATTRTRCCRRPRRWRIPSSTAERARSPSRRKILRRLSGPVGTYPITGPVAAQALRDRGRPCNGVRPTATRNGVRPNGTRAPRACPIRHENRRPGRRLAAACAVRRSHSRSTSPRKSFRR